MTAVKNLMKLLIHPTKIKYNALIVGAGMLSRFLREDGMPADPLKAAAVAVVEIAAAVAAVINMQ